MDNFTHSLIGYALGHVASSRRKSESPKAALRFRSAAMWTSILASNLPDSDFVLARAAGAGNLNYLLQHRGYTHTWVVALALGGVSAVLGAGLARSSKEEAWSWMPALVRLGLLAGFLHIGADFWNDYGIHPFWPFSNRWFYGDFIFIVEPSLWLALIPLVVSEARSRLAKGVGLALAVGMLTLAAWRPEVPPSVFAGLVAWAAAMGAFQWVCRRAGRPIVPAIAGSAMVLGAFIAGSWAARDRVIQMLEPNLSRGEQVIQMASTPAPANPFCWKVIVATLGAKGMDYRARLVGVSLLPGMWEPEQCFYRLKLRGAAPLVSDLPEPSHGLRWYGEFHAPAQDMRRLDRESCLFSALLRFARFPFWSENSEGLIAGDLRYDFDSKRGFTLVREQRNQAPICPKWVPPWEPPVSAVLTQ